MGLFFNLGQYIWFKRLRLCEDSLEGDTFTKKYTHNELELFLNKYKNLMKTKERITIPHNYVDISYTDDEAKKSVKKESTDDFISFFNTDYLSRMFEFNLIPIF